MNLKNLLDDFAEGRRPRTFIRRNMRYRKVMAKYLQNITVTDDPKSPSKNTEETVQKMSRFYTSIGFGQILQLEDINSVSIIKLLKYESFWEPEPIFDVFVKKRGPAIDKKVDRIYTNLNWIFPVNRSFEKCQLYVKRDFTIGWTTSIRTTTNSVYVISKH